MLSRTGSERLRDIGLDRLLGPSGNRCRDLVIAMIVARLIAPASNPRVASRQPVAPTTVCPSIAGVTIFLPVVMRRLDERCMLDHAIAAKCVDERALDRLVTLLARFYQHAARVRMTKEAHLADWRKSLVDNRRGLFDPRAQVPAGLVHFIDGVQQRFLARRGALLAARAVVRHLLNN